MQILHVTPKTEVFSCIMQHVHRAVCCSPGQFGAVPTELYTSAKAGPKTYQQAWVPPHHKILYTFSHVSQQGPNNRHHSHAEATQPFLNYAGDQKHGDDLPVLPSPFFCPPVPAVK